jgi:hypothetical protein
MVSLGAGACAIARTVTNTAAADERSLDVRMAYTLDHVRSGFNCSADERSSYFEASISSTVRRSVRPTISRLWADTLSIVSALL